MADEDLVEEYLDSTTTDKPLFAAGEVMDTLADRLKDATGAADRFRELAAAGGAIANLSADSDSPKRVVDVARDSAGDVAQSAGIKKDRIISEINEEVGELEKESIEESGGYQVEHGLGVDRFLEHHLEEVVVQRSTDAVDAPILRWRFDKGERVETEEGLHFDHYHFFKKLSAATSRRLVPELASEQAEDHAESDIEYAQLSLGPEDRPWAREGDLWARSISGLLDERSREETVVGPRTEAWEHIRSRISSGRGVRDLDDAVAHGMIYVAEDVDEIWVPTSLVSDACESVEISRRSLQSELAERGVDSKELSGNGISEALTRKGTSARFWRLDASHDEVPELETVLDAVDDPTERSTGIEKAEEDGDGTTGTEQFGRDPSDEESDEEEGGESE